MEESGGSDPTLLPAVGDQLGGWAPVDIYDERDLGGWRALWGEQDLAIENGPVIGFEFEELGRGQLVIVDAARLPYVLAVVVGAANQSARRRHQGGEFVDEMLAVVGEYSVMGSIFLGDGFEARAVQLHRIDVAFAGIVLVTSEIDYSGIVVHRLDAEHFEIALGELALQLGLRRDRVLFVETIEIELGGAIAPA